MSNDQVSNLEQEIRKLKSDFKSLQENYNREFAKLDQEVRVFTENLDDIDHHALEAASILRYYAARPQEVKVEDLDGVFGSVLSIAEIAAKAEPKESRISTRGWSRVQAVLGMLPQMANRKRIPPGELLDSLITKFGKQFLQANLDLKDVAAEFGTEEAIRWKTLIEG